MPANSIKFKKTRKGKLLKYRFGSNNLKFGTFGLKASKSGIISLNQINAAKQAISKKINKKGKIWIRINANLPITSKPTGIRMGKGKGQISHWSAKVRGGNVLFEICGVKAKTAVLALKTGSAKLPFKTQIFN